MLTEAKEKLKQEVSALENEAIIQDLLMYLMGMQAQKSIPNDKPQTVKEPDLQYA